LNSQYSELPTVVCLESKIAATNNDGILFNVISEPQEN
jgi:hypothetical protein